MGYKVIVEKGAQKYLDKLSGKIYDSISETIDELANNPRPNGCVEIKPYANVYRIRKGDFRIVYEVRDGVLLVLVLDIGSRGQIYDKW